MKKTVVTIGVVLIAAVVLFFIVGNGSGQDGNPSVTSTQSADTSTSAATSSEATSNQLASGTYTIDTNNSTVEWTAYKTLVDGYEDNGTFPVTGIVTVSENGSIAATTTLDIANLNVTSVSGPGGTDRLANHLRSEDFFAAEQYPTATLTTTNIRSSATSSSTYDVTADLTMKGVTNEISFPADISMEDGSISVRADTEIDRSRWNIRYGSQSFFNDLGDNVIGDMVDISVDVVASVAAEENSTSTPTN